MWALGKRSLLTAGMFTVLAGCRAPDQALPALPLGVIPSTCRFVAASPGDGPVELAAFRPRKRLARRARPPESVKPVKWQPARPVKLEPSDPPGVMGHGADYRWLSGRLRLDPISGQWSIQYGDLAVDDFGGVLELVRPGPMAGFKPGQLAHVEGMLIDPVPMQVRPGYRPTSIQSQAR